MPKEMTRQTGLAQVDATAVLPHGTWIARLDRRESRLAATNATERGELLEASLGSVHAIFAGTLYSDPSGLTPSASPTASATPSSWLTGTSDGVTASWIASEGSLRSLSGIETPRRFSQPATPSACIPFSTQTARTGSSSRTRSTR